MDRRDTPPKRATSPTWSPPPPCKQKLKFTTQKYSTKKSFLLNYNLSLSFRNKAVYNEILTHTKVLFENMHFLLHVLNKMENIFNAGYWVLSENRKN